MSYLILDNGQLAQVATKLVEYRSASYKIVGHIKDTMSDRAQLQFIVDQWPDFRVVLGRPSPHEIQCPYVDNCYYIFATSLEPTAKFLREDGLIDWTKRVIFAGLPESLKSTVHEVVAEQGMVVEDEVEDLQMYKANEAVVSKLAEKSKLPPDFHTDCLREKEGATVAEVWDYRGPGADDYISTLIEHGVSVCVRESSSGKAVGWCVEQNHGIIGMLYVRPEHRKRGFGKHLVLQASSAVLRQGRQAYVYVNANNHDSIRLHEKCGYEHVEGMTFQWLPCSPKSAGGATQCTRKCCV